MPSTAARVVLRPARLRLGRGPLRNASTTAEATNKASSAANKTADKAKEGAQQAKSKASEGLSKVQSSASSSASKVSSAATDAAEKTSGRIGSLINSVQSLIPPTVYYSKVGWEMTKFVFQHQKMSPPSGQQLQSYYNRFVQTLRNPSSLTSHNPGLLNPQHALHTIRNISSKQMATAGIVAAEVVGFFTVGEILGKRQLVGYAGKSGGEHH